MKWLEKLALIIIIIIAGTLRVGWPGINSFGYDEARLSLIALEALQFGHVPLIGLPSSGGLPNFPAAAWLLMLPYAFTHDPLVVTLFIALFNTLIIVGLWWLGRVWVGRSAGMLTAFMAATSPYLVLYSRNIWAQNMLPTIAIAWAIALTLGWRKQWRWAWAKAGFLAAFAVQVHFAGVVLFMLTGIITLALLITQRRTPLFTKPILGRAWQWLTLGMVLGVLLMLPTVVNIVCCREDVRTQMLTLGNKPAMISPTALQMGVYQAANTHWQGLLLGEGATQRFLPDPFAEAMTILILVVGCLAWLRRGPKTAFYVIILWAVLPILAFTRHITPVNPQYLILGLPALFLWMGAVAQWGHPLGRAALALMCIGLSLNQGMALAADLTRAGEEAGGIGTPLYYPRRAIQALKDEASNTANASPIVIYTEGDDPATQGDPAVFEVLLCGYPHRVVDGRYAALIPSTSSKALLSYETLPALPILQALGARDEQFFARRRSEPLYVTERMNMPDALNALKADARLTLLSTPIEYENGVLLIGWRWEKVGNAQNQHWRMSTIWQLKTAPNDRTLHLFHHVRAGVDRQLIAQEDVPMSSGSWQVGDLAVVWADFKPDAKLDAALAAGQVFADIGIYRNPGLQRIAVAPHSRQPTSTEPTIVTLSPLRP